MTRMGMNKAPIQLKEATGTLIWITGLSGAGKTTIAKALSQHLSQLGHAPIFLDGDRLREIMGADQGFYDKNSRLELAKRYARLCAELVNQGFDVICATISMFPEIWEWNRQNVDNYHEIYIRVPIEILIQRDQKGLYTSALQEKNSEVMGVNLSHDEPLHAHITIENDGSQTPQEIAVYIANICTQRTQ